MSIQWGKFSFEGPYLLDEWNPPQRAGIYAIMHKPDRTNKPSIFQIDYFGESGDFSDRGFPWSHEKSDCFIEQAGSKNNVYIAIHFMPGSTESERQGVETELIGLYDPKCNKE